VTEEDKSSDATSNNEEGEAIEPSSPIARIDLPKWNRARVKRNVPAAGGDDLFQGSVRKAGRFTLQRAPLVLAGIIVLAGVFAGIYQLRASAAERRATSTRILADAVGARARGRIADVDALMKDRKHPFPEPLFKDREAQDQAVDRALERLHTDAGGTSTDQMGDLVRAARDMQLGAFAEAETKYRAFLAQHLDHILVPMAREGLALSLEAQGKLEQSLDELKPLLDHDGAFFRDQALWHQGRILERLGRRDDAIAAYRKYVTEYPLAKPSFARTSVRSRLEELAPELVADATAVDSGITDLAPESP